MLKKDELENLNSCLNKAKHNEMLFTLRAHDVCAPATIRHWVSLRLMHGKNVADDPQIKEALECADFMEKQYMEGLV